MFSWRRKRGFPTVPPSWGRHSASEQGLSHALRCFQSSPPGRRNSPANKPGLVSGAGRVQSCHPNKASVQKSASLLARHAQGYGPVTCGLSFEFSGNFRQCHTWFHFTVTPQQGRRGTGWVSHSYFPSFILSQPQILTEIPDEGAYSQRPPARQGKRTSHYRWRDKDPVFYRRESLKRERPAQARLGAPLSRLIRI